MKSLRYFLVLVCALTLGACGSSSSGDDGGGGGGGTAEATAEDTQAVTAAGDALTVANEGSLGAAEADVSAVVSALAKGEVAFTTTTIGETFTEDCSGGGNFTGEMAGEIVDSDDDGTPDEVSYDATMTFNECQQSGTVTFADETCDITVVIDGGLDLAVDLSFGDDDVSTPDVDESESFDGSFSAFTSDEDGAATIPDLTAAEVAAGEDLCDDFTCVGSIDFTITNSAATTTAYEIGLATEVEITGDETEDDIVPTGCVCINGTVFNINDVLSGSEEMSAGGCP